MRITLVAERYAKAVFDLAVEKNQVKEVYADASLLNTVCLENKLFVLMMKSPVVSEEKKEKILTDLFAPHFSAIMMKFLLLLIRKNRELYVQPIARTIINLYREYNHILTINLTTAVPATDAIRTKVRELVKNYSHWNVELEEKTDPSIIGGFILSWSDLQYDASIRYQIERLRRGSARINLYKKGF